MGVFITTHPSNPAKGGAARHERVIEERNDDGELVAVHCSKCPDYYISYK
jgi:hypothetical protein